MYFNVPVKGQIYTLKKAWDFDVIMSHQSYAFTKAFEKSYPSYRQYYLHAQYNGDAKLNISAGVRFRFNKIYRNNSFYISFSKSINKDRPYNWPEFKCMLTLEEFQQIEVE